MKILLKMGMFRQTGIHQIKNIGGTMGFKINMLKWVSAVLVLPVLCSGTALAAGTQSGTPISNQFTLKYKSADIDQPQIDNADDPTVFVVDRRVDLVTSLLGSPARQSTPGQRRLVRFSFRNESNNTVGFRFTAEDFNGPDFTVLNPVVDSYWIDLDNDSQVTDGTETVVSYTDGDIALLPPDEHIAVRVFVDVPLDTVNGDEGIVLLTAIAVDNAGVTLTADSNNTLDGEETILDDGQGENDGLTDAIHSTATTVLIVAPELTATKTAAIVSTDGSGCDSFTQAANTAGEFALPGACVEYTISVSNQESTSLVDVADATDIDLADVLESNLILTALTHTGLGGSFDALTIPATGLVCDGTDTTCNVVYTGGTLAAGDNGSIRIRALIDDT